MTTVLGAGASLMIRACCYALSAFLILLVCGAAALAQDTIAVTPTGPGPVDDSWSASIALIRDSLIATILAVITGVVSWASAHAPAWLRAIIDRLTTSEAIQWDDYVRNALNNAFDTAAAKVGATPENLSTMEQKADFLGWSVRTLRLYNADIVSYLDKDANGVIDLVETELVKRGAPKKLFDAPVDEWAAETPQEPPTAPQFADVAQPRRVPRAPLSAPAAMAAKLVRRPRGTVVS